MQIEVRPRSRGGRLVIFDLHNVMAKGIQGSGREGREWACACQLGRSLWVRQSVSSLVAAMTTTNLKCPPPPSHLLAHSSPRTVEDEWEM